MRAGGVALKSAINAKENSSLLTNPISEHVYHTKNFKFRKCVYEDMHVIRKC